MIEFITSQLLDSDREDPREQALRLGYLFLPRLIDPEPIRDLRLRALEVAAELGWLNPDFLYEGAIARPGIRLGEYDSADWVTFQTRVLPTPEFHRLGEDPALLGILERLFRGAVAARQGDICRVMSPGTPELTTVAHQDRFYLKGSIDLWTAWIPLGDCPKELGGLAVLPGSHLRGLLPHQGEGSGRQGVDVSDEAWATAHYKVGDVLLFHCLTIHRALPNLTLDRIRISADYRYAPAG